MGKSNADRQRLYRDRQREARAHAERLKAMAVLGDPQGPLTRDGSGPVAPATVPVDSSPSRRAGGGQGIAEPTPEPVVAEPPVSSSSKPIPPPSPPPPLMPLERYVEDALLGAEIAHSQIPSTATLSTKTLAETLERAEAYARWRFAGVLAGTVNGL